jgi:hypothetical protein
MDTFFQNFENRELTLFFSGGLDSSILYEIASRYCKIVTMSTSYPFIDNNNNTEKEYAISAAEMMGINIKYIQPKAEEYCDLLVKAIKLNEEPIQHLQTPLLLYLIENIDRENSIILTGFGADGFWGTNTQYYLMRNQTLPFQILFTILRPFKGSIIKGNKIKTNYFRNIVKYQIDEYREEINDNHPLFIKNVYGDINWISNIFNVGNSIIVKNRTKMLKNIWDLSVYDRISYIDYYGGGFIVNNIFGKLSSNYSHIMLHPYFNKKTIDLSFSIPWDQKLKEKKSFLKKVAKKLDIDEKIINRRKTGMGLPPRYWTGDESVFSRFDKNIIGVFPDINLTQVNNERMNRAMIYWNLINYSIWKKLIIEGKENVE